MASPGVLRIGSVVHYAIQIVKHLVWKTNHTFTAEALEKGEASGKSQQEHFPAEIGTTKYSERNNSYPNQMAAFPFLYHRSLRSRLQVRNVETRRKKNNTQQPPSTASSARGKNASSPTPTSSCSASPTDALGAAWHNVTRSSIRSMVCTASVDCTKVACLPIVWVGFFRHVYHSLC